VQFDPVLFGVAAVTDQPAGDRDVAIAEKQQRVRGKPVTTGAAGSYVPAS
jgi:hypothetical protein